ncbi:restriction endonuclease [Burkholderia cenocepacia]|uniref:restriction endonuclease n=1 Tax=Burkholderia cenocepacia TaxID=95486 RepID=UPI003F50F95D
MFRFLRRPLQRDLNSLKALDWRQFERLVAEAYRRLGYRVRVTGQGGADGGVDLILTRGTEKVIVQCKQWQSTSIGASVVREMFGLMAHHKATAVAIVCTGKFTRDAATFAAGKPIELVTGNALAELVESVRRGGVSPARARPVAAGSRRA